MTDHLPHATPATHDGEEAEDASPAAFPPCAPRRWRLLAGGLIILLPVVVLAGAWRLGGASALEDDLLYYLPIRSYIGERLSEGELPLWNPWTSLGTSIAADPQAGLWYPTTWLFAILPPRVAYPLTLCLHFALAGGGMYRFLRSCRHRREAALLAALAFELGGFMVAQRAHLTIHHAAAWLPWMLFAWRRFADRPRYRYFALASLALGVQLLVQHLQVTILSGVLLSMYVVHLLWTRRDGTSPERAASHRLLISAYAASLVVGLLVSAVQWLPTFHQFAGSGRNAASYHLFIENAWVPSSAILSVFPMIFGSRTPNVWSESWWGLSHFCEQSAYASILILVLALASPAVPAGPLRRQVKFWWLAIAVALVLALGPLTPLSSLLFHVPIYRNLRVPARWLLVVSVALPVLASCTLTALLRFAAKARASDREHATSPVPLSLQNRLRRVATRWLPITAGVMLALLIAARLMVGSLDRWLSGWYDGPRVLDGLRSAIRFDNPAIWWPVIVIALTAVLLLRWMRRLQDRSRFAAVLVCLLVDLSAVAAFVDVDVRTYAWGDIIEPPALAKELRAVANGAGHRLLVPRRQADYARPIEVLSPQTNLLHGIATANGYGPLTPVSQRLLLRFMPWGAGENIIALLRHRPLLRALGVRYLAAASPQERLCLAASTWADLNREPEVLDPGDAPFDLVAGEDRLFPILLDGPGLYEVTLEVSPVEDMTSRWFIGLEDSAGRPLSDAHAIEPVDLSAGPRTMPFLFLLRSADGRMPPEPWVAAGAIRLKSEHGRAVRVGRVTFRRLTALPERSQMMERSDFAPLTDHGGRGGLVALEVDGALPDVYWSPEVQQTEGLLDAVERLWTASPSGDRPLVLVEGALPEEAAEGGPVRDFVVEHHDAQDIGVSVVAPRGGWVVLNQTLDPGWSAQLDGVPVPIRRANAVFQAVHVPAGAHQVNFRYRPKGMRAGLSLSAAGLAGLILAALVSRVRGRRDQSALESFDRSCGD